MLVDIAATETKDLSIRISHRLISDSKQVPLLVVLLLGESTNESDPIKNFRKGYDGKGNP